MLNNRAFVAGVALLLVATAVRADPAADAKAVVDRAVKALGGQDKLAKVPATTFKCKATVDENGNKGEFSGTWSIQPPDKYRAELELVMGGRTESVTLVINGAEGWAHETSRNRTEAAPPEALTVVKADFGAIYLAHHPAALAGKEYTLSHLGEVKIDNRAAVGVKVERKDLPSVDLFFDKETSLPVKAEVRVKERKDGDDVLHTFLFQDYKEVDGVKHFSKLILQRLDKEVMAMELSELKRVEKHDATLFDKP